MTLTPFGPAHREALASVLPAGLLGDVPDSHRNEPRGRYRGIAETMARPRSTEEVARIVTLAAEARFGVVPYGGGTGLVGGQIPLEGPPPLLLSLDRLDKVRDVSLEDNVIIAEAGVILSDLRRAAEDAGRLFPLSLASEGSARIGGNLATNAGGVQVLRYGNARDLCLGIEAVMADGTVLHGLKRLRKDNTGYDIRHLLIGSEGTLGIITAASLKLYPRPGETVVALVTVPDPQAAISLLRHLQSGFGETVSAFELIHRTGFDFLAETLPEMRLPFSDPPRWSVLTEIGAPAGADAGQRFEAALAGAMERGLVEDALVAQNAGQAAAFWALREHIPEANRRVGSISSHDISVPISALPAFIEAGFAAIRGLDESLRVNCFGHLGDGNLHYNVFPAKGRNRESYEPLRLAIKDTVHDLAHRFDGSVSAEHGIGRLKTGDLERYGDPARLAAMRAVKAALDPQGILNPGAVLG